MTQNDLQQWALRLKDLGKSLPTYSPTSAHKQLTTLMADLSLAMSSGDSDIEGQESLSVLKAIQGVTEFNRASSPVKLELWGRYHGKYFVIQSQPEISRKI